MIQFLVERELTGSNAAAAGGDTGGNSTVEDPRKKTVMQYLIDLLTREFNRILEIQLGLFAAVQNDAQPHASSVDTDTSEPKAECSTAPHNKKLKLLEDMERDFDEPPADANRNVNHELLQEIVSYLGPVRLSTEEKLCPLLFW
jgi:hypothetical protein